MANLAFLILKGAKCFINHKILFIIKHKIYLDFIKF